MGAYKDAVAELRLFAESRRSDPGPVWGTPIGFPSIDDLTGGLHDGEVTIIAARTSQGKTAFGSQIVSNILLDMYEHLVETGEILGKVVLISPEMTGRQLMLRQASQMSQVPARAIQRGSASDIEYQNWLGAVEFLEKLDPFVEAKWGKSVDISAVPSAIDRVQREGLPVKLLLVDYLQRITAKGINNAYERATHISTTLKDLANEEEIPLVVLSQLNRDGERTDKDGKEMPPRMSDIRDSGRIEEDADNVWLLWRPNQLTRDVGERTQSATLTIEKARNGPVAAVPLAFVPRLAMFEDLGVDRVSIDGGH